MKPIHLHKKIRMLHPYKIFLFILAFISLNSFDSDKKIHKSKEFLKETNNKKNITDGSDFTLSFYGAAPLSYNHATGGGNYNQGVIGTDIVTSLEGGDFKCGETVTYLTKITVDPNASGTQNININYSFDATTTGQPGVGFDQFGTVQVNTGDPGMVDNGTATATLSNPVLTTSTLTGTVTVSGLVAGDIIIVRTDVHIACIANSSPTGNLGAGIMSAATDQSSTINVGTQTITLKSAGDIVKPECAIAPTDPVCPGSTNSYTATSSVTNATYNWTISGDGTIVGGDNGGTTKTTTSSTLTSSVDILAGTTGSYTIGVTISKDGYVNNSCSQTITVKDISATPTVTSPVYYCLNATASPLSATATGTLTWYGPDGTTVLSGAPTPSTTTVGSTTYYVTSTEAGKCESAKASITVTINALPTITITGTASFCTGGSTLLTANATAGSGTITGYQWYLDGNLIQGATSSTYTATAGGSYTVTVTNSNTCSATSAAFAVTVNALPTVNITGTASFCAGGSTLLTANATAGSGTITGYQWYLDGNLIQGATSSTYTATAGGSYTVTVTNSNTCSATSAAFVVTVNPLPPCTITVSGSPTTATLGTPVTFNGPAQIGTYQYTWALTANTSGAIFVGSHSLTDVTVTVITSTVGSYTLTLSVTNTATGCTSASACSYKIISTPAGPFFTYTQGFYGNIGGSACLPGGLSSTTAALITSSINNMMNKTLYLGSSGKSFTMVGPSLNNVALATQVSNLIKIMPGGTTPSVLAGNYNVTASSAYPPLSSGKIKNVLLAQAITLAINISIPGSTLGSFPLQTGYLTTINRSGTSCTAGPATCPNGTISSLKVLSNAGLVTKLNGKTVADLLSLASSVLGGGALPTGVSLSDINNAIDAVNRSFDGGRFFLGYYSTAQSCGTVTFSGGTNAAPMVSNLEATKLSATAYPNPFTDKVTFSVVSPVSGKASLDIYNIMGQKLHTVYQGYLFAGRGQVIEYNVPSTFKGALIYTLKVGDQQVNGKLIQVK